jgi:flavorubredoxin
VAVVKITDGVWFVGTKDWDRRLFDELIPLPHGTTYNSYLVEGKEKTVLVDTVDPTKRDELLSNLAEHGVKNIDYVIAHHGEQDHSGSLPAVIEAFPTAQIVCSTKAKPFLIDLLLVPEDRFLTVGDGDTLELGGKTLRFIMTPWVHWPETMVTYLAEDNILFSCDFFGSHFATSDLIAQHRSGVYHAARTYYAEIMMPFRGQILRNLEKLKGLDIKMIAPSHGPIYDQPKMIMDSYAEWASDDVKNMVVIPYISMHGSTQAMVDRLVSALIERGVGVKPFMLSRTDTGELASALVDAATVVIGSPTVLAGPHPLAIYAATLTAALKPKIRYVSVIGSYLWGGKTVETLAGIVSGLSAEVIEPVYVKGYPKVDDLVKIDALADAIAAKHATL